jgi:hypothetical protein
LPMQQRLQQLVAVDLVGIEPFLDQTLRLGINLKVRSGIVRA